MSDFEKLTETCKDTLEKLQQVFEEVCMIHSQAYEWFKQFKHGRFSVESDEQPGRPVTSNTC